MKTLHPPKTALDARFESEMSRQAGWHRWDEPTSARHAPHGRREAPRRPTAQERRTEDAMILGR